MPEIPAGASPKEQGRSFTEGLRGRLSKLIPQSLRDRYNSWKEGHASGQRLSYLPQNDIPQDPLVSEEIVPVQTEDAQSDARTNSAIPDLTAANLTAEPVRRNVRRLDGSTDTKVEYGELTWTTAQTVRDILQNHLDANSVLFVNQLVGSVINLDQLNSAAASEQWKERFEELAFTLYRYKKGIKDFSPQARVEMGRVITQAAQGFPLKGEMLDAEDKLDINKLTETFSNINEVRPDIKYRVRDTQNTETRAEQWVSLDELQQEEYRQSSDGSAGEPGYRYQIIAVEIGDIGTGFDAALTTFYKSDKAGKKYLRGRFGEGSKMSAIHSQRNGARVRVRSRYLTADESGQVNERYWQARPYIGDKDIIHMKGVHVEQPPQADAQYGSSTLIDLSQANPTFAREFAANVDPRIGAEGLASNCLEYSDDGYVYPVSELGSDDRPVGVNVSKRPTHQYVQGLRVPFDWDRGGPLFSYNFLDSSILQGRDRNGLRSEMSSQVSEFWRKVDSPVLLQEMVARAVLRSEISSPEKDALTQILYYGNHRVGQERRIFDTAVEAVVKVLGLSFNVKNVVVSSYLAGYSENKVLIEVLKTKGFNVITVGYGLEKSELREISKYYDGALETYTLEQIKDNPDLLIARYGEENEGVKEVRPIIEQARANLQRLLEDTGFGNALEKLSTDYIFAETIDPKIEQPIELVFDQSIGQFQLRIRPDMIRDGFPLSQSRDYWEKRLAVEMLMAAYQDKAPRSRNDGLQNSQNLANKVLIASVRPGLSAVDALPAQFDHFVPSIDTLKLFIDRLGSETNVDALRGWEAYRDVRKFNCSLQEFESFGQNLDLLPEEYRSQIEKVLLKRLIVVGDEVGYYDMESVDNKKRPVFTKKRIDELATTQLDDGTTAYIAGSKLFVRNEFAEGDVLKIKDDSIIYTNLTFFFKNGNLFLMNSRDSSGPKFGEYKFDNYPVGIDQGCLYGPIDNPPTTYSVNSKARDLLAALGGMKKETVEQRPIADMEALEKVIDAPISIDYGKDAWNDPVRVFEDITQNHLDASPDGKIGLRYEVQRNGSRVWIDASTIEETDVIVGFTVSDKGGGYTPDGIGTMGDSSKKDPMLRGKYGEGQKMIAAAAARNGLELVYSSLANYEGKRYRWAATVGTRGLARTTHDQIQDIGVGRVVEDQKVVYALKSDEYQNQDDYTSATILRLPENANEQASQEWQKWMEVIDPRNRDERGNSGLSRYILNLREIEDADILEIGGGVGQVLLNESGAVYENGIKVLDNLDYLRFSYNFPLITLGRDRNSPNIKNLMAFIGYALTESDDPRLAESILGELRQRYLGKEASQGSLVPKEADLNLGVFRATIGEEFVPAMPLWKRAYRRIMPGYIVHSEDALRKVVDDNITMSRGSVSDEMSRFRRAEISSAERAIANVVHLPAEQIMRVDNFSYKGWKRFLPTSEEYSNSLSEQEVVVDPVILDQLRTGVIASAQGIFAMLTDMSRSTEGGNTTLGNVLTQQFNRDRGNSDYDFIGDYAIQNARLRAEQWADIRGDISNDPNKVFVAPAYAGYLGSASDRVGLNEQLLMDPNTSRLIGVIQHELGHDIFGLPDYKPEFIMMLLEMAKYNLGHGKPAAV